MSKTTARKTARPKAKAIGHISESDLKDLTARIDRTIALLAKENAWEEGEVLPDLDAMLRVARIESETLNPEPVQQAQQILRNGIRLTSEVVDMAAVLEPMLEAVQRALDATEELAARSGFFVGLACGTKLMMDIYEAKAQMSEASAQTAETVGAR